MKKDKTNAHLRNIAIIAHVDHGKTTLVDALFKQSGLFRENQETQDRLMDRMDLERERGITIAAKNCSIKWSDVKINILDTPGHADFGGEVERALSMVDGAILLVDASEGPLPQTRFVLGKALAAGLKIIVVVNKIDRPDARCEEVLSEVYDLLIDLDADEEQLEFPLFYANGREGIAGTSPTEPMENLHCLLDAIVQEIPGPRYDEGEPFQMMVSDLSYSDYLGRLAVGKVVNGSVKARDSLICMGPDDKQTSLNVSKIQVYQGPMLVDAEEVEPGEIVVLAGIDDVFIGDTICHKSQPKALKRLTVDEPTVSMRFTPNSGPFQGQEGKLVQSSKIRERLEKETMLNVSVKVEEAPNGDGFIVKGRGEFQMVILIETMRREGFELCVGRPQVIFHKKDGKTLEPIEHLYVDCEEEYTGIVTEKLSKRKGRMLAFVNHENGRARLEFSVPSRALIGYRDEFLTDTRGTGILNSLISGYEDYRGDFAERHTGSLVGDRTGEAVPYALYNLEPRGIMFITPGEKVYEGMIVGEHNRENDLDVNPCKTKKLSNVRASGKDDAVVLTPVLPMTLERAIQFIREDEMVEVTPHNIRLRKRTLAASDRKVENKRIKS
ncbi:MAG: translational GTPase TypA [Spirochaetales bacterium]|nr:translational GTPase TypA [Spirochaetales bacterium]